MTDRRTETERRGVYEPTDEERISGPLTGAAPFPPERPADDTRPDSQKEQEAMANAAALEGEHGSESPYLEAPKPEGHHAGDYQTGDSGKDGSAETPPPGAGGAEAVK